MKKHYLISVCLIFLATGYASAQLTIDTTATAIQLAQKLVGVGVTVSNPVLNCSPSANAKFSNGSSTQLGINDGIFLCNGRSIEIDSPYDYLADTWLYEFSGTGYNPDLDLDNLLYSVGAADTSTFDACTLEFDVTPLGDTLSFTYVFGSEEYEDFTCSIYTDVFGFFITGPIPGGGTYTKRNIALIPGTNLPVAINTVNCGQGTGGNLSSDCISTAYSSYYVWDSTICYSGSTIPMKAIASVIPCQSYHLKLAVADVGDGFLDSGVFIEGGSLNSNGLPVIKNVAVTSDLLYPVRTCADATITLLNTPPSATPFTLHFDIGGTAINGTDYTAIADSVNFPANDSVVTININPLNYPGAVSGKTITLYLLSSACGAAPYDSITVDIEDSIVMTTGPAVSMCTGDSVILSAVGVPNCIWHPGATLSDSTITNPIARPAVTTTYVATFSLGVCTATDSTTVTVTTGPQMTVNNDSICQGNNAILTVNPTPPGGSYDWTANGDTTQSITVSPASTTQYTVLYTIPGCTPISETATVTVSQSPTLVLNPTDVTCFGYSDGSISATITPSGTYTYLWSNGETSAVDSNLAAGPYSLILTNSQGCAVTASTTVNAPAAAALTIVPNDSTIASGSSITLFSTFTGYPISSVTGYAWSPATGLSCWTCDSTTFTPGNTDSIYVDTLKLTYNNGCIITAYDTIKIKYQNGMAIPNAFTPNGDGKNDTYFVTTNDGIQSFQMTIYNRWGQQVFKTTDINTGWDGTYKDKAQPVDVYTAYILFTDLRGKSFNVEQSINLFR